MKHIKHMWYVYIVRCADDTLYTGITTNLERRMREHNSGPRSAKYTRVRTPITLVYSETSSNRSAASIREAALKKLPRSEKLLLIQDQSRQK